MFKHIIPISFLILQAIVSLGQNSFKTKYTFGDLLLADSVEKIFSQTFDYNEVKLEKKFSIKNGKSTLKFSYQKRYQNAEVLEVVLVKGKEQYVETYFIDNKTLIICMMMQIDSRYMTEPPYVNKFYFLNDKLVYGWSFGTPMDDGMGEQILKQYAARRSEMDKRLH